ncbi:hypothetical protein HYH02_009151 [Chlamydomonas schloesseri]|uniref:Uncharacterized protein n=1 Tax=Chlamydomonas schloesseri TaxID=2026947 RepID=A0A835WB83_9CHLO|nr:hypothetical protein HYH02_009151 [Chlamydomonas schloesseri]|eukprot:KAG2444213.1 hypothetical protein HYH02_009151 [Chlamydomonas schloesseri]
MASLTVGKSVCRPSTSFRCQHQTLFGLVPSSSSNVAARLQQSAAPRRGPIRDSRRPTVSSRTATTGKEASKGADISSKDFAIAIAKVADDVKCLDVVVLDVAPVVSWTSFLVVATVFSKPQLLAALARVEKAAAETYGRSKLNLPGSSPWETLDFGDVVLHLFTAEQREYYDIESFYAAAEEVELPFGSDAQPQQQQAPQPPTWSTKA